MGFTSEYHSKPLRFLKNADRALQKKIESFLQYTELPEYTFQFVKPSSEDSIKNNVSFWWERPSSYRTYHLILNESWPAVLVNMRNTSHAHTARIPLLRAEVNKAGPIVFECLLDENDRILWIVDILHSKGVNLVKTNDFLKRYELSQRILTSCIQSHSVLQSCEVRLAPWKQLCEMKTWTPTPKCCVEMACMSPDSRRFVWRPPPPEIKKSQWDEEVVVAPKKVVNKPPYQNQHNQQNQQSNICQIVDEPEVVVEQPKPIVSQKPVVIPKPYTPHVRQSIPKNYTIAYCSKDTKITGPDLYVLEFTDGTQLGSAAIRTMSTRLALRSAITKSPKVLVNIEWYDNFNKYEIKSIVS